MTSAQKRLCSDVNMSIKDYFKPVVRNIVIAASEETNLTPLEESEVIASLEKGCGSPQSVKKCKQVSFEI